MAIDEPTSDESRIDELIAAYLHAIESGEALDKEKFLAENVEYSEPLRSFIHNHEQMQLIAAAAANSTDPKGKTPTPLDSDNQTLLEDSPVADHPQSQNIASTSPLTSEKTLSSGMLIAGRYQLISKIGEGGMGEVWVAKQIAPLKRKVAIKLIKTGMDSKAVAQRFEQERQALAMMDHPNIAKVLDGGINDDGRPFFALELVNGLSLSKYCDETRLSIRERLELFVPVCQAVQHAHQKGIVHRDLKPSNLLVTVIDGRAIPKIIDFGVAKALGGNLTEQTMSTQFGAIVGTLEYMSPEQAGFSGSDIDTRADIYSLGVILYEMLTGLKPFDSKRLRLAAIGEMLRIISEEEPSKPSTRISTDEGLASLAALRGIEPAKLPKLLRGELDWVVMKCLEKKRDRRYETANALAQDIKRYLSDETVEARPPSTAYQIRKLIRRHKGLVITSSLIFLCMFFGVIGTTLGLLEAKRLQVLAVDAKNNAIEHAASEAKARQDEQTARKEVEQQKKVANDRAEKLQETLAGSYFRQGIYEYDAGQPNTALIDLTRALAMMAPENPLHSSYRRVLVDRCVRGGRQLLPPLWHDGPVNSASFNLDGTRIVTASEDKTVRIWDTATGTLVGRPMLHEKGVSSASFNPDGTQVVTRSLNVARLWDALSGSPIGEVMVHSEFITSATFSSDGTHVLTSSIDKTARLWDARSGLPFGSIIQHDSPVYCAAISPNGRRIATGTGVEATRGALHLWDAQTIKPVGNANTDFKDIVRSVNFSADSSRLLTGCYDRTARVLDAETGAVLDPRIQDAIPIQNAIFSPDQKRILTCDSNFGDWEHFRARLWDAKTGTPIGTAMEHAGYVCSMAFSPDGTLVATASKSKQGYAAFLWDSETGESVGKPIQHQNYISSVSFSPDGTRVLTGSSDHTARLWNLHSENLVAEEMNYPNEDRDVVVAYSPDGTRFVTGGGMYGPGHRYGIAHLYDGRTGSPNMKDIIHPYHVTCAAFSQDGIRIVTGCGHWNKAGQAQVWDARTGAKIGEAMKHRQVVQYVAFSPDGNRIITASTDGTARLWDALTGVRIGDEMKHTAQVVQAGFSPDGNRVVTASFDLTARIWNAHTGTPQGKILTHESSVCAVAFSPDGRSIASGSWGGTAQLWDAESGEPRGNEMKHDGEIDFVGFSRDGTRLITGSRDFTTRLWDAHTGAPLGEVMRHEEQVKSVTVSQDGELIATASSSSDVRGAVQLWEANTGASLGTIMNHRHAFSVAFSPDRASVISGGKESAKLWNVTIPESDPNSAPLSPEILQLWTGCDAKEDGAVHLLVSGELDSIRRTVGNNDPLRRFVVERWQNGTPIYHTQAARAAEGAGRWSKATIHLGQLIKMGIGNSAIQARYTLAQAKLDEAKGDLDRALKGFDESIRLDPNNNRFYSYRGHFRLDKLKDRDAARTDYLLEIRHNPLCAARLNDNAWYWATSLNELNRNGMLAVITATRACELTEWESSSFIDTLAAAYAEDDDFENSVKWQTRAIEICPKNRPEAYRNELLKHLELYKSNKPCRN